MRTWIIELDTPDGTKTFVRTGDIEALVAELKETNPKYKAITYRVKAAE